MKKQIFFKLVAAILALSILVSCTPQNGETVSLTSTQNEWELGEAYIPKNNPTPILIHSENSATPAKFSYTDNSAGEEMNVDIKNIVISSPRWDIDGMAVLKTYDELKSIQALEKLEERPNIKKGNYYTDHYDENFFKQKALVMLLLNGRACEYEIPKVLKRGTQMCVCYRIITVPAIEASAQYRTFIEVSKKDLDKVKTLVIYFEKYSS